VLLLLAGCTTQVTYTRTREPLEKERLRNVRVVAVLPFRNTSGDPGAPGLVEARILAGIKDSFRTLSRKHVNELAMERAFGESDLVDPATRQKIRNTGADTAICGEVMKFRSYERRGVESVQVPQPVREVYTDNQGRRRVRWITRMVTVPKPYLRVTATAAVAIHVVRLSDSATLVSHAASRSLRDQGGGASGGSINRVRSGDELLQEALDGILRGFLAKVVKTEVVETRTLDKYVGDGVEAAENGDWEIASRIFWAKYLKDKEDPATLNNVAVCIEATAGNDPARQRKAIELYRQALEIDYDDLYSRNLRAARSVLAEVLRHQTDGP
jgi:hypothetical protein